MPITLTPKQTEAIKLLEDDTTRRVLFGGGAGSAKSFLGTYWLIRGCIKYPGTRWLMGRAVLLNLKRTTLETFFQVAKLIGLQSGESFRLNNQTNIITFYNGSKIVLMDLASMPSDPNFDRLGSLELTGAFIDEISEVSQKAYEIVSSRIRFKLDEYGLTPKILATCNPSKGWIYMDFFKPAKEGTIQPHKAFIQATVFDNPYISAHYLDNLRLLSSEVDRQRLLYGNWDYDDDPARLIDFNKILDLFTNEYVEPVGKKYITTDIAIHGSDKFTYFVWHGWRVIHIGEMDKNDAKDIEEILRAECRKHGVSRSDLIYDADGIGAFLRGYLRGAVPFTNGGRPYERTREKTKEEYANAKTQCYFELAKKIQAGEIYVENATQEQKEALSEELSQVKRDKLDQDGKLYLMPKSKVKEAIGRSPDYADAMMMRMWLSFRDDEFDYNIHGKSSGWESGSNEVIPIRKYSGDLFDNPASKF